MKPYTPKYPKESGWYMLALLISGLFAVIMFMIVAGCCNPVSNDRDGLVIQRPCSDCHIVIDGKIQEPKVEVLK